MATLDDLVAKQSQIMGSIKRALTNFKKMGQAKMTLGVTRHRLTMLKESFARSQELDAEILIRADPKTQNSHPYFTEEQFLLCEEAFNEAADFMAEIISTAELNQVIPSTSRLPLSEGRIASRLPQLRLPQFDGSFNAWETFRDKFTSLIINDASLNNVDRMHYLSSCITGDASNAIAHLAITVANFHVAWKILTSRYENKRRLITFHIHALHNLPTVKSETYRNLRDLSDKVNASIQALLNLGRPVKQWDDMLVYLVTQRLDSSTRKAWELHLGDSLEYPSFNPLNHFLDSRIRALESLPQPPSAKGKFISQSNLYSKSDQLKTVSSHSAFVSSACPVCQANNLIYQCAQFQNQTPAQRYAMIKNCKRCVNCFGAKHTVKDCPSARSFKQCNRKHHTLLHFADSTRSNSNDVVTASQSRNVIAGANVATDAPSKVTSDVTDRHTSTLTTLKGENDLTDAHYANHVDYKVSAATSSVLLATARARVLSANGQFVCARALLDQGSAVTIITENLAQLLRLPKLKRKVCISGVGDTSMAVRHTVNISFIPARASAPIFETSALVLKSLTKYIPHSMQSVGQWSHIENLNLADNDPMSSDPIAILIGADLYGSIILDGVRKGLANQPIAQNTSLGWILSGPVSPSNGTSSVISHHALVWDTLSDDLRRFWEVEELQDTTHLTPEEIQCEEHFLATHSRTPNGRYIVRLPFKSDPSIDLGESRTSALTRFYQLEKRLSRDIKQLAAYRDFMEEYRLLHHMEPVSPKQVISNSRYYIPHHAVYKIDSDTTPIRVVFNASSRTASEKSLNDCLLIGPKLQTEIPSILIRWRQHRYVYIADSAKMYRQILLDPRDRDYQIIFWRNTNTDPLTEFRLCTVTYGTAPAAYLAQRVLKQLGEDEGAAYPLALPVLKSQMYVDDFIFGADDRQLAINSRNQLISLLHKGGFRLRKWASNCRSLLQGIDPSDHGLACEQPLKGDEYVKVLGICWNPDSDTLKYRVQVQNAPGSSKRAILSLIARLFDPLGLVAPVIIIAKILMQKLWTIKCEWDDQIPPPLLHEWERFYYTLAALNDVSLNRWTHYSTDILHYLLHGFSDASNHAYAAVVYCRLISVDGSVLVSLLMAKSKVAPLKTLSIPRLELLAALLLSKLMSTIRDALPFKNIECHCWTDSTITLAWLQQPPSRWQTFVANRVSEIQTKFPEGNWHHVSSKENPADCASRGLHAPDLQAQGLWWEGPSWLRLPPSQWPAQPAAPDISGLPEQRRERTVCNLTLAPSCPWADRFSSWPKLLRVFAYVFRFLSKSRHSSSPTVKSNDDAVERGIPALLRPHEIQSAKNYLLRSIQLDTFRVEYQQLSRGQRVAKSSPLASLNPFLDSNKLIRVGGRLQKSEFPDKLKHPIVLRSHPILSLIISHHHLRTLHAGPSLTLASLRDEYWIIRARSTIRSVLHRCVLCARENAIVPTELMGSLPAVRTNRSARAFVHTGVDYAGPIFVREASGRGRKSHKAYIAVFICMVTKAIHLELVHDYGSPAFLAAFHRFSSRRGLPQSMYSDNGTNFQGAERELVAAHRAAIRDPNFLNKVAAESIIWHFIPPAAPHFGGLWEAGVRSVKYHLKRYTGNYLLTVEELTTLLCRIEACLNSRPIAAVSENIDDYDALTPGHFLIGAPLIAVPEPSVLELNENRLSRWQLVQRLSEAFWRSWSRDYLHTLQQRPKWRVAQRLAAIGRVVLLRNPQTAPCKWELGRIVACHPGDDGITRVVTVKTGRSTYTRPIGKLCFLPVDINEADERDRAMAGGERKEN